jgi:hypothetical protein
MLNLVCLCTNLGDVREQGKLKHVLRLVVERGVLDAGLGDRRATVVARLLPRVPCISSKLRNISTVA